MPAAGRLEVGAAAPGQEGGSNSEQQTPSPGFPWGIRASPPWIQPQEINRPINRDSVRKSGVTENKKSILSYAEVFIHLVHLKVPALGSLCGVLIVTDTLGELRLVVGRQGGLPRRGGRGQGTREDEGRLPALEASLFAGPRRPRPAAESGCYRTPRQWASGVRDIHVRLTEQLIMGSELGEPRAEGSVHRF